MKKSPEQMAEDFLEREKQFHLGFLATEKPHPKTRGFDEACINDLPSGIRMLGNVDRDIIPKAREVFSSEEFSLLISSFQKSLSSGGRIIFSGCGATGRLGILLAAAWRKACVNGSAVKKLRESVVSIMTGGDYALVRSVESFEDYMSFGKRQAEEAGVSPVDTFVAVSEGGETSSVIGSALEAASCGAEVFFVFNNPAEDLCKNLERSRIAITHPQIIPIDLCTGPMALTGSTRMQAITIELLVLGCALEDVFRVAAGPDNHHKDGNPADTFEELLGSIFSGPGIETISLLVKAEADVYLKNGLVTYFADKLHLDIFTDTTERAPTFMLPSFVKDDDGLSPQSWAFVKNPVHPTKKAWFEVFGRKPSCLEWRAEDYKALGASEKIISSPPAIGYGEILKFRIGNEIDNRRFSCPVSAAVGIISLSDVKYGLDKYLEGFNRIKGDYSKNMFFSIGPYTDIPGAVHVPCGIKDSPLMLWEHLAVKIFMNTVSTATMPKIGRVKNNWMNWVEATNKKLVDRSTRLISELCGISYNDACAELFTAIQEIGSNNWAGEQRPSPVQYAINRIKSTNLHKILEEA